LPRLKRIVIGEPADDVEQDNRYTRRQYIPDSPLCRAEIPSIQCIFAKDAFPIGIVILSPTISADPGHIVRLSLTDPVKPPPEFPPHIELLGFLQVRSAAGLFDDIYSSRLTTIIIPDF
jgi:hypothetical protein